MSPAPAMTEAEYRALDAVNWSTLCRMADSPAHYRQALLTGRKDTQALRMGRLIDVLTFTPELAAERVAVSPFDSFRSGEARAWRDQQAAEGRDVYTAEELVQAQALADAVRAHPVAGPYIARGRFQVPMVWTDPHTGLRCKGLADLVCADGDTFLLDGKSARTADKRRWLSEVAQRRYHCQLAHYRQGCRLALGFDPAEVGHIVCEKGAPYDVGVFTYDAATIDQGEADVRALLERVAECRASGHWPGRYPDLVSVTADEMPGWMFGEGDPEITFDPEE